MKKLKFAALMAAALLSSVGAQADTISQSQEYAWAAGQPTNWGAVPGGAPASVVLSFSGFDSTLGTLNTVSATLFGKVIAKATVNAVTAEPFGVDVNAGARIRVLSGPGAGAQVAASGSATTSPLAAGSNDLVDFGTIVRSTVLSVNPADFLASTISFSLAAVGSNGCTTSGGNNGCDFNTVAGAKIDLVYDYTANTTHVPEPASLALVGLALAGVGLSRRRKA